MGAALKQTSFSTAGFDRYAKTTKRAAFLAEMDAVVPWSALCDTQMHQTKKGNQWYFGMKAHFGVDRRRKVIHSVVATAANVHDSAVLGDLLHGEERDVWGDQAYQGQSEVIKEKAPNARDRTNRRYRNRGVVNEAERARNRKKSKVRSRVEHVIGVIKQKFGFTKVRYRGLEKNANRLFATCALANLYILRHQFRAI
jgi:IS5 family transposase